MNKTSTSRQSPTKPHAGHSETEFRAAMWDALRRAETLEAEDPRREVDTYCLAVQTLTGRRCKNPHSDIPEEVFRFAMRYTLRELTPLQGNCSYTRARQRLDHWASHTWELRALMNPPQDDLLDGGELRSDRWGTSRKPTRLMPPLQPISEIITYVNSPKNKRERETD